MGSDEKARRVFAVPSPGESELPERFPKESLMGNDERVVQGFAMVAPRNQNLLGVSRRDPLWETTKRLSRALLWWPQGTRTFLEFPIGIPYGKRRKGCPGLCYGGPKEPKPFWRFP